MELSFLGGRAKHLPTIGDGIVLLSRHNALYRKEIGSCKLDQISLRVFPAAVLRKHALTYTYGPFVNPIWKVRSFGAEDFRQRKGTIKLTPLSAVGAPYRNLTSG